MSASLVGSEMCIRDRARTPIGKTTWRTTLVQQSRRRQKAAYNRAKQLSCLLYTSDAADDM
eukprot:7650391-Alexandrium_andersonii.AAC.1